MSPYSYFTHKHGNLQLLNLQEAHFAVGDFTVTKARSEVVDFMASYFDENNVFIVKYLQEDNMMAYFNPFKVSNIPYP